MVRSLREYSLAAGAMHAERTSEGLIVEVGSEAETDRLGRALAEAVGPGLVIGLVGPLGAGKTRLARAVAEGLGVDPGAIASPTFVLIHEYDGRLPVYHFDTYRLSSPEDFEALGVADYWQAGGVCLVEWADRVLELLPEDHWLIGIEPTGPVSRRVSIALPSGEKPTALLFERINASCPLRP
jgi:tRNA threonylcarbamoyladenosine biosynthesis protein TsaE